MSTRGRRGPTQYQRCVLLSKILHLVLASPKPVSPAPWGRRHPATSSLCIRTRALLPLPRLISQQRNISGCHQLLPPATNWLYSVSAVASAGAIDLLPKPESVPRCAPNSNTLSPKGLVKGTCQSREYVLFSPICIRRCSAPVRIFCSFVCSSMSLNAYNLMPLDVLTPPQSEGVLLM
jgi:hypothetical protein